MHTFTTTGPPTVVVRTGAGQVNVTARDVEHTTVTLTALNGAAEDAIRDTRVEQDGSTVLVDVPRQSWSLTRRSPQVGVEITCPTDSRLDLSAESSDLRADGRYAEARLATGSGEIVLEDVTGPAQVKSGSGQVTVGQVDGPLAVTTGSGDVAVHRSAQAAKVSVGSGDISLGEVVGELLTKTGSGDVEVGRLDGELVTKTGSGSLVVRRAAAGSVRANGASGNISIGIEEGTAAWLELSTLTGRVTQELGQGAAPADGERRIEITAHTVSGNLRVHRS